MITDEQRRMMRHALGYGDKRLAPGWRNRYVCRCETPAWRGWQDLVSKGLAEDAGPLNDSSGSHFFYVTDAGKEAVE